MNTQTPVSSLDRFLHRLAFSQIPMQKQLSGLEDRLFAHRIPDRLDRPVFITSLARAGTTLFLELVSALPDFATHTYRQMPFLLSPLLWQRFAGSLQRASVAKERAHADGMEIGFDSPEAFEEVLWAAFWQSHYKSDRIEPWSSDDRDNAFEEFFRAHLRKITALGGTESARYVSKNNANIARLDLLTTMFPDAIVIVPIRNPVAHVQSLRRQHRRFLQLHSQDRFARDYMSWLGHFEFGASLRPINFNDWLDDLAAVDPEDGAFWLTYWVNAFETVLAAEHPSVHLVDYDRACLEPEAVLNRLAETIGVRDSRRLVAQSHRFRPPRAYSESLDLSSQLGRRAHEIHSALEARAIGGIPSKPVRRAS